jgi:hypothetical protein
MLSNRPKITGKKARAFRAYDALDSNNVMIRVRSQGLHCEKKINAEK